jgi:hypothetical protein
MMTAAQFHKRKTTGSAVHTNPISADIYTLLQEYEAANSPNKQLKILVLLYFLCLEYEWGKFGVRGEQPSAWNKKFNLVLVLKRQLEEEIGSPSFQQKYANKLRGESYKGGVKRADVNDGTRLKGVYGTESISPQQNSVAKYNLNTQIPTFGISLLSQEIEQDFQLNQNMGLDQSQTAAHNLLSNMSLTDVFKKLHAMGRNNNLQNMQFSFFDSAQRQQYLATYANAVWSCNGMTPFNTGIGAVHGGALPKMYVMDMTNRIFIPDGIQTGGGDFNHSSLLSGKPVLCAGEIKINGAGQLTYIDNNSGHYKPDKNSLKLACRALMSEYHIPVFGVTVMDQGTQQTKSLLTFINS